MDKIEIRDSRQKGWYWMDDLFLNGHARYLSTYAKNVYMALCRHANENQQCWPSYKTMATKLNISLDAVRKSLKELENMQIIRKEHRGAKDGGRASNLYTLRNKNKWKKVG